MKIHLKWIVAISVVVIVMIAILLHLKPKAGVELYGLTVSTVQDVELFIEEQRLNLPQTNDIHIIAMDDNTVLVIDDRNEEKREYTNSTITATMSADGLLILVKDSFAVTESDITGRYAVIIRCDQKVSNVDYHIQTP